MEMHGFSDDLVTYEFLYLVLGNLEKFQPSARGFQEIFGALADIRECTVLQR